jgi:hypothetical protein
MSTRVVDGVCYVLALPPFSTLTLHTVWGEDQWLRYPSGVALLDKKKEKRVGGRMWALTVGSGLSLSALEDLVRAEGKPRCVAANTFSSLHHSTLLGMHDGVPSPESMTVGHLAEAVVKHLVEQCIPFTHMPLNATEPQDIFMHDIITLRRKHAPQLVLDTELVENAGGASTSTAPPAPEQREVVKYVGDVGEHVKVCLHARCSPDASPLVAGSIATWNTRYRHILLGFDIHHQAIWYPVHMLLLLLELGPWKSLDGALLLRVGEESSMSALEEEEWVETCHCGACQAPSHAHCMGCLMYGTKKKNAAMHGMFCATRGGRIVEGHSGFVAAPYVSEASKVNKGSRPLQQARKQWLEREQQLVPLRREVLAALEELEHLQLQQGGASTSLGGAATSQRVLAAQGALAAMHQQHDAADREAAVRGAGAEQHTQQQQGSRLVLVTDQADFPCQRLGDDRSSVNVLQMGLPVSATKPSSGPGNTEHTPL